MLSARKGIHTTSKLGAVPSMNVNETSSGRDFAANRTESNMPAFAGQKLFGEGSKLCDLGKGVGDCVILS